MTGSTDRRTFIKLSGAGVAALAVGSLPAHAWASPDSDSVAEPGVDPVTDLGEPVHKTQALSSVIGHGPDGEPLAFFFVEGNPTTNGEFAVVDIRSQRTILDVRIPLGRSSQRTMGLCPVTGHVYFGTADRGELYRYRPGADDVDHLGEVLSGQRIWEVAVGDDGTVWGGTYPGGLLFSYNPDSGEVTNHGQALPGEQYIGAIEQVDGDLYVGTQPNGRLARYSLSSGGFTEVEFPDGPVSANVSKINRRGDLLFVTTGSWTYVRDLGTDTWKDQIPSISGYGVSPLDPETGRLVYMRSSATIKSYDVETGALESIGWSPNATPEDWAWIDLDDSSAPGPALAMTYWNNGRIYARNIQAGSGYYHQPTLMGAGAQLVAIGAGPEGSIYTGAYLSPPGMGRWDPDTEQFTLLDGTSQIEGYGTFKGDLVFGRYPQGRLYRYDPSQPWRMGTNPGAAVDLEPYEQNRCQSFVEMEDRVAVASVPTTGRHNGAITLWDPDTNHVDVFRGVVENQTPVSLVLHDGLLYGGTSINGGYGIDPVTEEAKLFAWDPVTHETLFEMVPVPGAPTVSGLVVDDGGRIWALAGGTLIEFDPDDRTVVRRVELFAQRDGSRYGNEHVLLIDHGRMFGVTLNKLFVFDPVTEDVTVLYDGSTAGEGDAADARHLAMDRYGDLFFIGQSTRLFRYGLPDDTTPPVVRAEVRPGDGLPARRRVVKLSASDDETGVAAIQYRIDDGPWETYRRAIVVDGSGGHVLKYRAVDHAWNASAVQVVEFANR
ncbi:twin-arginine translocation signal domain-containing protein [Phytoactinopolyspora alkaliphila]|uniref:Twin-arginine translocation signal domain-containing protein n=1 Tax=Phytoactinopolyspora alkaliphila TaxID=1783498 RepID=A0A6N9YL05_9ACTN|nr:twin-arginine translocation signal domain-containing protein [Phytoactinopolyspora alkaliphila]NED95664.1 twin-arginine translocation signal domain-containing protein [Phytoactinopolyspora alkaliphila]